MRYLAVLAFNHEEKAFSSLTYSHRNNKRPIEVIWRVVSLSMNKTCSSSDFFEVWKTLR